MKYSYEILSVDQDNKMMEVKFTSDNDAFDDVTISCDIPREGVNMKSHLNSYAPVPHWELKVAQVQSVTAGLSGDIWTEHPEYTPEEVAAMEIPVEV